MLSYSLQKTPQSSFTMTEFTITYYKKRQILYNFYFPIFWEIRKYFKSGVVAGRSGRDGREGQKNGVCQ